MIVWSRLYFDLEPYLSERSTGGTTLLTFYHRQLGEAAAALFLETTDDQQRAHAHLADYFHRQEYFLESLEAQRQRALSPPPTPRPANQRKVDELPWQRLQAGQVEELQHLLSTLDFLEAKAEGGMVFDLATDFTEAARALTADHPRRRIQQQLEEALRMEIHFIARHPTTLFQCLWNTCWWYDCPDAAKHYAVPGAGWAEPPPWESAGDKLCAPLERWRAGKEAATPGFWWLRSHRPPPLHLGTAQRRVLRGHEGHVMCVAVSADGMTIVSGSWDRTVRIWDAASGEQRRVLRGHEGRVMSVAVSADGTTIVSGSRDETVRCGTWRAAKSGESIPDDRIEILRGGGFFGQTERQQFQNRHVSRERFADVRHELKALRARQQPAAVRAPIVVDPHLHVRENLGRVLNLVENHPPTFPTALWVTFQPRCQLH